MVWQKGIVDFWTFFNLFIPSAVNWLVPAVIMSFAVPRINPEAAADDIQLKRGAFVVIGLFLLTIATAVSFHNFLHLPPMMGMMTGLSCLKLYGYYLKKTHRNGRNRPGYDPEKAEERIGDVVAFDVFRNIARAEWDTLMFFYGVILCVGGLSAIVDNIPVMFAVLTMKPDMSMGHWLLVTLTAGVGGSMLSIGSAAGVALMGQARGMYTFGGHLKWLPVIALGYFASIGVHFLINSRFFNNIPL